MKKFVFWGLAYKHTLIALTENLSGFAAGETFWKALETLISGPSDWAASAEGELSDPAWRMKMYQETGLHKVEISVAREGGRFAVGCANSRSLIEARAKTSSVNNPDLA